MKPDTRKPIAWHENCLKNMIQSHKESIEAIARMQAMADRIWKEIKEKRAQIDRAKAEGKLSFDEERYNVKRGEQ